jgi:hypothetical protein
MSRINFALIFIWNTADQPPYYRLLCGTYHWKADNTLLQAALLSLFLIACCVILTMSIYFLPLFFSFIDVKCCCYYRQTCKSCHLKERLLSFKLIGDMQQSVVNQLNGSVSKRQQGTQICSASRPIAWFVQNARNNLVEGMTNVIFQIVNAVVPVTCDRLLRRRHQPVWLHLHLLGAWRVGTRDLGYWLCIYELLAYIWSCISAPISELKNT